MAVCPAFNFDVNGMETGSNVEVYNAILDNIKKTSLVANHMLSRDGMFLPGYEKKFQSACRTVYNSTRTTWKDLKKSPAEIAAKKIASTKRSRKARVTFFF